MYPILVFIVLLVLSFAVMAAVLQPTKSEAAVQKHLQLIGQRFAMSPEGETILKQETLSAIPWLNDLLQTVPGAHRLRLFIKQAGSKWSVGPLLLGSLLAAVLTASLLLTLNLVPPLAVIAGLAAGAIPYVYLYFARESRFQRFEAQLPEAIDLMSRALRAGHSVISAIEMVSQESLDPVAPEFRILFEEQNLGLQIREAMTNLTRRVPLDDVRFVATAILIQRESGGNLAEVLDKTTFVIRERMRLKGQLRIFTAQGRITGWILCLMPFFVAGIISLLNPKYEKLLWTDPLGLKLVYAGLIFMGIGIFVIRKIISIKV